VKRQIESDMKTLLIPVDFSDTTMNAIEFAAGYSKQFQYDRILLLKSFYNSVFESVVMSAEYGGVGTDYKANEHEDAEKWLAGLSRELSLKIQKAEVVAITSELPLMRAIAQVIEEEDPRTILVGSDNNAYDNDSYVGSHVIPIAKASPINVLIVPAGVSFQTIERVLIPVDLFTKASLVKIDEVSNRPFLEKMKLDIIKFDAVHKKLDHHDQSAYDEELHRLLGTTSHRLFSSSETKAIDAITNFLQHHSVQLILSLPGKYSFLYRLTHQLLSEAICRNTEKPVLIMK
jgi:hypothetical protein